MRTASAPHVLTARHGLEMSGIDAATGAAQVVQLKPLWDRTYMEFVRNTVSATQTALELDFPITKAGV